MTLLDREVLKIIPLFLGHIRTDTDWNVAFSLVALVQTRPQAEMQLIVSTNTELYREQLSLDSVTSQKGSG